MKIGFIGLGIMGRPMAKNLLRAGHALTVCDHHPEHTAELAAAGARAAETPRGASEGSELVITMLPNSPNVREAVCGEAGVLEGAAPGTVLVDMSSIAPGASQEIAAACAEKGVKMLDAPVSGGEPKAVDGTLSIMAGGERAVFEAVRPVLLCMGASAVWCGEIGAGNTTKLANQVIVAANIAAVSEAMMLACRAGVDPARVFDAVKGGLAGSAVLNAKTPMMLERSFAPGFRIDLHIKDLGNALETGHAVGAPLPLTAAVMEMMQTLRAGGCGGDDHSALVKFYEKITGETIA
ncbi:2-hydroxy-3-oxopropionate reductase [uncultured Anaerotruncus sp.]|uniref:2-hydroxy-3-oxopropionate reductase n=1 Tax=uncultured Anaerotruncus sp. TaxID=905011 RepID=UPI00280B54E8|nr:2-hydroxy-3-oxopropionate reductase [uncultured Anaerotruncus sp.]